MLVQLPRELEDFNTKFTGCIKWNYNTCLRDICESAKKTIQNKIDNLVDCLNM